MARAIDPKYQATVIDGRVAIVKTRTGEPIPLDEPLALFRAKDRMAVRVLETYLIMCHGDRCTIEFRLALQNLIDDFEHFAKEHPERMKRPD